MATQIGVNIGSGNGLLPDGTKPLPEPMLTLRWLKSCGIHPKSITQEMLKTFILGMSFKIINLSSQLHLPGTSELKETTHPQLKLTNCYPANSSAKYYKLFILIEYITYVVMEVYIKSSLLKKSTSVNFVCYLTKFPTNKISQIGLNLGNGTRVIKPYSNQ